MPGTSADRSRRMSAARCRLPPRGERAGPAPARAGCRHGADMELMKHGHACVVLGDGDRRLVIDPGVFTDAGALDGADAVLITHEHADHFAPDRLRAALDA